MGAANKVVITSGIGDLATSNVTATELGYLAGVTSPLQTQLNNKLSTTSTLNSLANFNTDGILVQTSPNTFTGRNIEGSANRLTVTSGSGSTGNPTLNISPALLPSPIVGDIGKFLKATAANTSVWSALVHLISRRH